jgi:hypothetical protein
MLRSRPGQTRSQGPGVERWNAIAVDRMIDSYVAWREACVQLRSAYDRWFAAHMADGDTRRRTQAACAAALDQEEQAAHVYRLWVERVGASARTVGAAHPGGTFGRSL